MIRSLKALCTAALFIMIAFTQVAAGEKREQFSPSVDSKGGMALPTGFRSAWVHLDTWVLTSTLAAGPNPGTTNPRVGIHNAYTQPESLNRYRETRTWPDGAVLIMEVRELQWDDLPTGHVIGQGPALQWFVMVKDAKGRFPGNPHWGDGWGWALFEAADPKKNISKDYKQDCSGCHEVAKKTDWIFEQGYSDAR